MPSMTRGFPRHHPEEGLLTAADHSVSTESQQHLTSTHSQIINRITSDAIN